MENEVMYESLLSELVILYTNKYGQNANIDVYYYKYTESLIKEVVQCISNPNSAKDISYFIGKKSLQKIRYYYGIDNQIDDKRKTNINSILSTLLFKIVFEAQIRYMSDKVKLDGPVPVSTPLSNFLIPTAVVNKVDRYLRNNQKPDRPLLLYDLITLVEEDKLGSIRNIGELYVSEMGRFVNICMGKEKVETHIEQDEISVLLQELTNKYDYLLTQKKHLDSEIAKYEDLLCQRKEIEEAIDSFKNQIKMIIK